MKQLTTHIAAIVLLLFVSLNTYSQVFSDFSLDGESWTTINVGSASPAPVLLYSNINGSPTGCIRGTDTLTGTWFYVSPAKFTGDKSAYYGGSIKFDMKMNTSISLFNDIDIAIIKSDGSKIVYGIPGHPTGSWGTYYVPLNPYYWNYSTLTGGTVSDPDMLAYLSDIKQIWIRGDHSSKPNELNWLDNVMLSFTPIILPVELSEFTAYAVADHAAEISWTTLSEKDCKGFEIEKSNSIAKPFTTIGYIDGSGTSSEIHTYTFTDDNFNETSYYRLKQLDEKGQSAYSGTISVERESSASVAIQVYPNPVSNQLNIENISGSKPFIAFEIKDLYGNSVMIRSINELPNGLLRESADVSGLSSGTYFLILYSEQGNESLPLQILH